MAGVSVSFRGRPARRRPSVAGRLAGTVVIAAALTCSFAAATSSPDRNRVVADVAAEPVAAQAADTCRTDWVTGWLTAPQAGRSEPAWDGATLRLLVHPQVAGSVVRLRLSNAYGTAPLTVGAVSVAAASPGSAALAPGTLQPAPFSKRRSVVIPAGADVVSDPVPLVTEAGRPVAVSLYLPTVPPVVTEHEMALQTSYVSRRGDFTLAAGGEAFGTPIRSWPVLRGIDVLTPKPVNAVVAVGDSITDGVGSERDTDARWSDALSGVLAAEGGAATMAVLNAGVAGNRLLSSDAARNGDAPITRFDRDVVATAGATDVVLHIGTNDIADGRSAEEIIAGLRQFADRVTTAGKRVILTTITPSGTGRHGTPAAIATRNAVNSWILSQGRADADGVLDFAAAVADPARPSRLAPAFDAGDGLHLSAAGYRALAGAVDPAGLTGSPCLAESDANAEAEAELLTMVAPQ